MRWASLLLLFLAGCATGPDYRRPHVEVPPAYRGAAEAGAPGESIGDASPEQVFPDPTLQSLLHEALTRNRDVLVAATRIEEAEAQLGITRADQLPTLAVGASAERSRAPGPRGLIIGNTYQGTASATWALDFWGRYRRATEAARADLLASEWNRRAVVTTLVANVASGYYQLLELDLELEIAQRTLASDQQSLELTQLRERQGAASMLDVRQAEQLVYSASQTMVDVERRREQQEDALSALLARNPGPIARGWRLTEQPRETLIPPGAPSSLLENRPDIQVQEARLVAANADIGVARAAYFPAITLTGSAGTQSSALADLFKGPSAVWSFVGSLTQPIFDGGRLRSGIKLAEAQKKEQLLTYQQTIQLAFRDVSGALVAYRRDREFREHQERLTSSAREAQALAEQRYAGGATSYLEVLDADTRTFSAEIGLAQARLNELLTVVQVYEALGGGWQAPEGRG